MLDPKNEITLFKLQYSNEERTWGDQIILNKEWVLQTQEDSLQLLDLNVKGIGTWWDLKEFEILLTMLDNLQVKFFASVKFMLVQGT